MSHENSLYNEKKLIPFLVKSDNKNITIALAISNEKMGEMIHDEIVDEFDLYDKEVQFHQIETSDIIDEKEISEHINECSSYIPQRIYDFE